MDKYSTPSEASTLPPFQRLIFLQMETELQQSRERPIPQNDPLGTAITLLQGDRSTPAKATALLDLLESAQSDASNQDDDISSQQGVGVSPSDDRWTDVVVEQDIDAVALPHFAEEGHILTEPVNPLRPFNYTWGGTDLESRGSAFDAPGGGHLSETRLLCFPCYIISALVECIWAVIKFIGRSCSDMLQNLRSTRTRPDERARGNMDADAQATETVVMVSATERVNRFEAFLKKALSFEETAELSTNLQEPAWNSSDRETRLFPGWDSAVSEYPLPPQGRFVVETKKAFDDFLSNVELGVNLQVMGSGGGFSSTGLPGLLKKAFTPYQWLAMWRSSEGRRIRVAPTLLHRDGDMASSAADKDSNAQLSSQDNDRLQSLENEILGLDKYTGGDSEYLTVITHSDDPIGSISLFKTRASDTRQIIQLDRVAMILEVPREICRILRTQDGLTKYELSRGGTKLKCLASDGLPPPQIIRVSNEEQPWQQSGGGWRDALHITRPRSSNGEGLVITIPQMVAFLHLRRMTATQVWSSPAMIFGSSLNLGKARIQRGVKLAGTPGGIPHVGKNPKIAVLFPRDSDWAREQFFWA
ncbi:hypothetical protein V496_02642 [Pseudogymnoascus sp. VKM F-4515 (FW-2607)]|nr:hypothetical protein V496_02642 [Pseudogymnoascus sp. VKM F-4515 (FW-2607)]